MYKINIISPGFFTLGHVNFSTVAKGFGWSLFDYLLLPLCSHSLHSIEWSLHSRVEQQPQVAACSPWVCLHCSDNANFRLADLGTASKLAGVTCTDHELQKSIQEAGLTC